MQRSFVPTAPDSRSRVPSAALVLFFALTAACADGPTSPPERMPPGVISVHTVTSGRWIPDGGLQVWVVDDPTSVREVGLNGSTAFELAAGDYEIEVFRGRTRPFYAGCSVAGGTSRSVTLEAGATVLEDFELFCEVVLELTSSTTGVGPDPNGYRLLVGTPYIVDQDLSYPVRQLADDAPLVLDRDSEPWWNSLPRDEDPHARDYDTYVYVWDVAPNCTLLGPNPLVLDVGGGVTRRELDVECVEAPPATGTIYYLDNDIDQVFRVEADGSGRTQLTDGPRVRNWALSPDATQIAYSPWYDGGLLRVDVDGSGTTRLTPDDAYYDAYPYWGTDGRILYVEYDESTDRDNIVGIRSDGTDRRRLTTDGGDYPSVSPDGERVLYDGPGGLTTMNLDGSDRTVIGPDISLRSPRWSPDGTRIAGVTRGADYRFVIAIFDPVSGDLEVVAHRPLQSLSDFAWAPDGKTLVFQARPEAADYPVDRSYGVGGALYTTTAAGRNLARIVEDVPINDTRLGLDWRE